MIGSEFVRAHRLNNASFEQPIPLVKLNDAVLKISELRSSTVINKINRKHMGEIVWKPLEGDQCSRLIDSYLKQIDANAFVLEEPMQPMYTSALFFLFEDAAITDLASLQSQTPGGGTTETSHSHPSDMLKNLKLQGDKQIRNLRLRMPEQNRVLAIIGCAIMVVLLICTIGWSKDPLRSGELDSSVAKYQAMRNEADYGNCLHEKTFANLPASSTPKNISAFEVDEVTLRRRPAPDVNSSRRVHISASVCIMESIPNSTV